MAQPSKCPHLYGMIYEDDYCCCTKCEQQWERDDAGWIPLVRGKRYAPEWIPAYSKKKVSPKRFKKK